MANFNARLVRIILFFSLSFTYANAQYVYIPDPAFRNFLINDGYAPAFNGDSLDTTSAIVTNAEYIECYGYGIQSLEGIQYFDSLYFLDCHTNYLTSLPPLPSGLKYLYCFKNNLSTLDSLPLGLSSLSCGHNPLYNLPTLPDSLFYLDCSNNQISFLPFFPSGLKILLCDSNLFQSLVPLPSNLTELSCNFNAIDSLPTLPSSLQYLMIRRTNVTNLPPLPDSLIGLDITQSAISDLNPLPVNLRILQCSLTSIDSLPDLPDSLSYLEAIGLHLPRLPALPARMWGLHIDNNNIDSLPAIMPAGLVNFFIDQNPISSLPALPNSLEFLSMSYTKIRNITSIPPNLNAFYCDGDSLVSLPSLPQSLEYFSCSQNQLTSLPNLPDSISAVNISQNPITCLAPISYIGAFSWWSTLITCLPNPIQIGTAYPLIDTLPLCQPSSGCPVYWNISGNIYHDLNFDCIKDTNEQELKNIPVLLDSAGTLQQICYTSPNGDYSFRTGLGNYRVRINPTNLPIPYLCPAIGSYTSQLTPIDSMDANRDFALTCPNAFDLYAGSVSPETMFRPTRLVKVNINAGDLFGHFGTACFTDTGFVQCNFNGPISYVGPAAGALTPTITSPGSLRWNVNDFSVVDPSTSFDIEVRVDSFAMINDPICFNLSIYPFIGDIFPLDNYTSACYPVRVAVDPNEKYMYPSGNVDTSDHVFNFTIFFQNTGNAPAEDIYIIDTLDNDLDASTFEFLSSTHEVVTQMLPGNILRFNFHGINLVDSVSNEALSHGQVNFRIHRKANTGMGTEITNMAYIYFDQNAPVATNEVYAIVTSLVNVPTLKEQTAFVYPNPALDQITVRTNGENILSTEILDLTGKSIAYLKGSNHSEMQIDLKAYSPGIYFAKIQTKNGGVVCRFIKTEN